MASIFGYELGVVNKDAGDNPNETYNETYSYNFTVGQSIDALLLVQDGTTLTNRMGDTWTFNTPYNDDAVIAFMQNTFVIDGKTYNYTDRLFLGRTKPSSSGKTIQGSYLFTATSDTGTLLTGHPTQVIIDEPIQNYTYISSQDNGGGIIEYIDGTPANFYYEGRRFPIDEKYISLNPWYGFALFLAREISFEPSDLDPYDKGGESGTGGGTGTFSGTGDNVEIPDLPTLSAVNTGFITLFNPTIAELQNLANYMWSDLFDLNAWKKIFADPMDAILGMSIVPVNVPSGGASVITVGNIETGVSMTRATSQFVTVDCGTLKVEEYWGAYLDYDPYTKAEIYLPYIGTHAIAVDDIMGKSVHVVYHVDILSGACCAYVKCGDSVLYTFVGQCSCSIPITGNDWTNVINGALSIATAIGSMVATGGASAPLAVSNIASSAINSMKPNVEKSGALGGMGGMMGIQTPYLILTRPRQAVPKNQNKYMGYPSFITTKLSDLKGYTEVESIHIENVPATEQELGEIESLLKGGVIL